MIRNGVIRLGIQALKEHPIISKWVLSNFRQSTKAIFCTEYLEGKGQITTHNAWWFKKRTQKPTPFEINLILKSYQSLLSS